MVRLKEGQSWEDIEDKVSFNSKMVRLKDERFRHEVVNVFSFQFQNGAIKSSPSSSGFKLITSFNSKMVRLKEIMILSTSSGISQFQFQNGAIKSV